MNPHHFHCENDIHEWWRQVKSIYNSVKLSSVYNMVILKIFSFFAIFARHLINWEVILYFVINNLKDLKFCPLPLRPWHPLSEVQSSPDEDGYIRSRVNHRGRWSTQNSLRIEGSLLGHRCSRWRFAFKPPPAILTCGLVLSEVKGQTFRSHFASCLSYISLQN
jgi:hypothetical protein